MLTVGSILILAGSLVALIRQGHQGFARREPVVAALIMFLLGLALLTDALLPRGLLEMVTMGVFLIAGTILLLYEAWITIADWRGRRVASGR
jgi:hypothetical protein